MADEIELSDEQEADLDAAWAKLDAEGKREKPTVESLAEKSSSLLTEAIDAVFGQDGIYP